MIRLLRTPSLSENNVSSEEQRKFPVFSTSTAIYDRSSIKVIRKVADFILNFTNGCCDLAIRLTTQ